MKIKNLFSQKILSDKWDKLLVFLIIFHVLFFSIFHILNKNYQTWDSAGHIGLSYRMAQEMERFLSGAEGASFKSILKISNYYPPFVQLIGSFISLVFGYKSMFLLIETLIFYILSILFTYKLTFLFTKDKKTSFLTAVIFSLFPQIIDQSHYFHLDIPLTALILMSVYYLCTSDNFNKLWQTLLFFIFFSFIQLTKWTGFVFLVVPVVIALYQAFIRQSTTVDKVNKIKIIRNVIVGFVVFLIFVIPWYYINWVELVSQVKIFSGGESDDPTNLWQSILYYPSNSISHQIMFLPFVLVVISIIYQLKNNWKRELILLVNILIPWLLFVFISNKNLRYTLPLTPLLAYLIADILFLVKGFGRFKLRWLKGLTVFYLFIASIFLSFFSLEAQDPLLKPLSIFFTGPRYKAWYYYGTAFYSYKPYKSPVDDVLTFIYNDSDEKEKALGVAVIVDSEQMSASMLELVRIELGYKNMYMPVPYFQFELFDSVDRIEAFFNETNSKYVITSSYLGPEGLRNYSVLKQVNEYLQQDNSIFEKIKDFEIYKDSDNSVFIKKPDEIVSVYRKKPSSMKKEESTEGCKVGAGIDDGVETIKLSSNHTYVFFTGHFAIQDKIWRDYEKGVMYVVQIENTVHESSLDIHNLPKSGSSYCSILGLNQDFSKDIEEILTGEDKCGKGIRCHKVVLVRWSVGEENVDLKEFSPVSSN